MTPGAKKVLGWPKRRKLARAFLWEYSYRRLQLAQLLGQLVVFLTLGLGRVVASYHLLIHAIPKSLTYSVPRFLKRQCDRTLGEPARRGRRRPVRGARAGLPGGEPAVAALVRVGPGPRLMTYYDRAAAAVFHVLSDASMNALCG